MTYPFTSEGELGKESAKHTVNVSTYVVQFAIISIIKYFHLSFYFDLYLLMAFNQSFISHSIINILLTTRKPHKSYYTSFFVIYPNMQ